MDAFFLGVAVGALIVCGGATGLLALTSWLVSRRREAALAAKYVQDSKVAEAKRVTGRP